MSNKIALVTGASDGIGKGIAQVLAKNGYDLMIHSARSVEKAEQLCKELTETYGVRAHFVQADLLDPSAPEKIFSEFDKYYDELNLYVNNAGVTEGDAFLELTRETVERVVKINLEGMIFCTQQAAKRMVAKKTKGNIVIITSNHQQVVMPNSSIYGAIKSAMDRIAKHISMELAPYGIRANTIAPGWVDSTARMEPYRKASLNYIPMRRWATVEEIGEMVLYLDSPFAASITGTCIVIDGGASNRFFSAEEHVDKDLWTRDT